MDSQGLSLLSLLSCFAHRQFDIGYLHSRGVWVTELMFFIFDYNNCLKTSSSIPRIRVIDLETTGSGNRRMNLLHKPLATISKA